MSKIDPKLEFMLEERRQTRSLLDEAAEAPGEEAAPKTIPVLMKFSGERAELEALGFQPQTVLQNLATGRISLEDLPTLAGHLNLVKLELSRSLYPELDTSGPSIGIGLVHGGTPRLKGAKVIIGIIDSGINHHDCFRINFATSRILFLWDILTSIEYTQAQLNTALANSIHCPRSLGKIRTLRMVW